MTDLEDLEYELALTDPAARRATFDAMVAAHPEHALELVDLLFELELDDLREQRDIEPMVDADDSLVVRAMERFRAALDRQR